MKKFFLMGNFSNEEIAKIIQSLKSSVDLKDVIFATITPTAMEWKVKEWLEELEKEDKYYKDQKNV
ncbi:MAG: DUF3783 domain-containing protein [Caldisericaceae bacterium]